MLQGEGLTCKNGTQDSWRLGGLPKRTFPLESVHFVTIDTAVLTVQTLSMNGFAINSSMIGIHGPIAPPYYVDFDETGAESVSICTINKLI